ncbi:MAG TPA: hypothetical protein VKR22_06220, partial [Acidimicrobiales bacterium]|nr:hypothetical protein [Acidimicrobiales bacterium]
MKNRRVRVGTGLKAFGVAALVTGATLGVATSAGARTQPIRPVVMHGHLCTQVASGRHRNLVGHAGSVLCAPKGKATLVASGPGTVFLIAGSGHVKLVGANDPNAHDILIGGTGKDTFQAGDEGDDVIDEGT